MFSRRHQQPSTRKSTGAVFVFESSFPLCWGSHQTGLPPPSACCCAAAHQPAVGPEPFDYTTTVFLVLVHQPQCAGDPAKSNHDCVTFHCPSTLRRCHPHPPSFLIQSARAKPAPFERRAAPAEVTPCHVFAIVHPTKGRACLRPVQGQLAVLAARWQEPRSFHNAGFSDAVELRPARFLQRFSKHCFAESNASGSHMRTALFCFCLSSPQMNDEIAAARSPLRSASAQQPLVVKQAMAPPATVPRTSAPSPAAASSALSADAERNIVVLRDWSFAKLVANSKHLGFRAVGTLVYHPRVNDSSFGSDWFSTEIRGIHSNGVVVSSNMSLYRLEGPAAPARHNAQVRLATIMQPFCRSTWPANAQPLFEQVSKFFRSDEYVSTPPSRLEGPPRLHLPLHLQQQASLGRASRTLLNIMMTIQRTMTMMMLMMMMRMTMMTMMKFSSPRHDEKLLLLQSKSPGPLLQR